MRPIATDGVAWSVLARVNIMYTGLDAVGVDMQVRRHLRIWDF